LFSNQPLLNVLHSIKLRLFYYKFLNYWNAHNSDAVFIWIPKCAGTSIYSTLKKFNCLKLLNTEMIKYHFPNKGLVTFGHMHYREIVEKELINTKFRENALKFSFVRNPYDRFISLFEYFKLMGRLDACFTFEKFSELALMKDYSQIGLFNDNGKFSHMNSQFNYLTNAQGKIMADFVGRFENLQNDFTKVLYELNISGKLLRLNKTERKPHNFYYSNSQTISNVYKAYEEDFDTFKYSKKLS